MSRQAHDEGDTDGPRNKPKAQPMGVQISRSVYPEVSAQGVVWSVTEQGLRMKNLALEPRPSNCLVSTVAEPKQL